jgi:hypothetical protein
MHQHHAQDRLGVSCAPRLLDVAALMDKCVACSPNPLKTVGHVLIVCIGVGDASNDQLVTERGTWGIPELLFINSLLIRYVVF